GKRKPAKADHGTGAGPARRVLMPAVSLHALGHSQRNSAPSAAPDRSTSRAHSGPTAATLTDRSPPSGSTSDATDTRQQRRSPGGCSHPAALARPGSTGVCVGRAGRPGPACSGPTRGGRTALQQLLEVLVALGRPLCRHAADAVGHQPAQPPPPDPPPVEAGGGGNPRPCPAAQRLDRDRPDRPQRPADARSGEPAGRAELGDLLGGLVLHTAELAGGREPGAHAERAPP